MSRGEEIGVPAGSPEIEVDGVRIAVAREGKGQVVVCLHAIGHGGADFDAFTAALEHRFDIVRIDWPGHGRSHPDRQPPSAARYATLLAGVLERLKVDRPIIVGNSIGGAAALIYAHRHPVRALVLCDTAGLVPIDATVRRFCNAFARFFAAGERGAWWYKPAFYLYYRVLVLPSRAGKAQRKRIIRAAREFAPMLKAAWAGFADKDADIRHIATTLDLPVWFAWARNDRVIPLSRCMPCINAMKNATLTTFAAGHAAFLEQPEHFVAQFIDFALRLDDAAGGIRRR